MPVTPIRRPSKPVEEEIPVDETQYEGEPEAVQEESFPYQDEVLPVANSEAIPLDLIEVTSVTVNRGVKYMQAQFQPEDLHLTLTANVAPGQVAAEVIKTLTNLAGMSILEAFPKLEGELTDNGVITLVSKSFPGTGVATSAPSTAPAPQRSAQPRGPVGAAPNRPQNNSRPQGNQAPRPAAVITDEVWAELVDFIAANGYTGGLYLNDPDNFGNLSIADKRGGGQAVYRKLVNDKGIMVCPDWVYSALFPA